MLTFDSDSDVLYGAVFICRAILSDERKVGRSIRLAVEGSYIIFCVAPTALNLTCDCSICTVITSSMDTATTTEFSGELLWRCIYTCMCVDLYMW